MRIRDIAFKKTGISALELINIVAFALNMGKEQIFTNADVNIEDKKAEEIEKLVEQRRQGKPLAYITKRKEFFSETFYVDERVLVPRPETELLVEEAISIIEKKGGTLSLLDVGTGCGTIGLIIAKNTNQHVICIDISHDAIAVAKKNAKNLGVSDAVCFVCADLLTAIKRDVAFDMILANLPYVPADECKTLMQDVRCFEPAIALDGGKNGIEPYRRLVSMLSCSLKKDGHVLFEIGGAKQAAYMKNALGQLGMNTEIKLDLSGKERVIIGTWTNSL